MIACSDPPLLPQVADIVLNARVWVYDPPSVKRAAIQAFNTYLATLNITAAAPAPPLRRTMISLGSDDASLDQVVGGLPASKTVPTAVKSLQAHADSPMQAPPADAEPFFAADVLALSGMDVPQRAVTASLFSLQPMLEQTLLAAEWAAANQQQTYDTQSAALSQPSFTRRLLQASSVGSALANATNATASSTGNSTTAVANATALDLASLAGLVQMLSNTTTSIVNNLANTAAGVNTSIAKFSDIEATRSNRTALQYSAYLSGQQAGWKNISSEEDTVLELLNATITVSGVILVM